MSDTANLNYDGDNERASPNSTNNQIGGCYPDQPGYRQSDPAPMAASRAAAEAVAPAASNHRRAILDVIRRLGPISSDDVAPHVELSKWQVRPRVSELRRQGLIEAAPDAEHNSLGRLVTRWRVAV